MSSNYNMHYSDPSKKAFIIVPMTTNGPAEPLAPLPGQPAVPLHPKAIAANTSLVFLGKGDFEYGEYFQESILHILENFAGATEPLYPIEGQLWYDNIDRVLRINSPYTTPVTSYSVNGANIVLITQNLEAANHFAVGDTVRITSDVPTDTADGVIYAMTTTSTTVEIEFSTVISPALTGNLPLTIHSTETRWVSVTLGSGQVVDLDMSGYRIINLGDPINPGDAVNLQYIVDNYLSLTGGVVNGQVELVQTVGGADQPRVPVLPAEAVNKLYVDQQISTIQGSFVQTTGDTMTGNLVIQGAKIIIDQTSAFEMASGATFDAGNNIVSNVATPIDPLDAANKQYVDQRIVNSKDGVVYAGQMLDNGNLVLQRTEGQTDVVIPGISPLNHRHTADQIDYQFNYPYATSNYIAQLLANNDIYGTTVELSNVLNAIGSSLSQLNRPIYRGFLPTNDIDLEFELPVIIPTASNRLQLYKNGLKLYENERSIASVFRLSATTTVEANSATALANGTYDFNIQGVNAGPTSNVSITVSQPDFQLLSVTASTTPILTVAGDATADLVPGTLIKLINTGNTEVDIIVAAVEFDGTDTSVTLASTIQPPVVTGSSRVQLAYVYGQLVDAVQAELIDTGAIGYQRINFSAPIVGTASTGLATGTSYTFNVVIDQQTFMTDTVTINGTNAQTFNALITALNTQGQSIGFTASISGSYIQLSSQLASAISTVEVSSDTLFSAITGYQSISTNVVGRAMAAGINLVTGELWFTAGKSGSTSRVTLSAGTNDLFTALSSIVDIRQGANITVDRDYFELGETGQGGTTNSILTSTPFLSSDVVEYIILR